MENIMNNQRTKSKMNTKSSYQMKIERIIEIEVTIANYKHQNLKEVIEDINRTLQPLVETQNFQCDGFECGDDWYTSYYHLPTDNEFDAIAKAYAPAWKLAETIRKNVRINCNPDHPLRIVARYLVMQYGDDGDVRYEYFPFIATTTKDQRYRINAVDGQNDEPYVLI